MYKSFQVQNFRGFKDLRLDDFARVNLIAGKNNTGKSALLEAILTYTGIYDASLLLRAPVPRYFSTRTSDPTEIYESESVGSEWEPVFHNLEMDVPIHMHGKAIGGQQMFPSFQETENRLVISVVDIDKLPENSRLLRLSVGERSDVPDVSTKFLEFRSGDRVPVHLAWSRRLYRNIRKPGMRFPAVFIPSSKMVPRSEDTRRFSELRVVRRSGSLLPILQRIEPRLSGLTLIGEPASIHGDLIGLSKSLPISSMGEGMRRLTSLLLAISTTEDGIVFIDEIENGLHYSMHSLVWNAIAETARVHNVQIFATTHSYEMIIAANEAFKGSKPFDLRLFGFRRNKENNEIRAVSYDEETLDAAIEAGFEVR